MKFRINYGSNTYQVREIQGKDSKLISHSTGGMHRIDVKVKLACGNDEYLIPRVQGFKNSLFVEFFAFLKISDNSKKEITIGVKEEVFETLIPILKSYPELQDIV